MKTAHKSTSIPQRFIATSSTSQMNPHKRIREMPALTPVQDDTPYDLPQLPEDVVMRIAGLLDIKMLAQFALVAKPFRDCPKLAQRLDFVQSIFNELVHKGLYVSAVSQVIDQHKGSKIQSLKLSFDPVNTEEHWAVVADWINKAAEKGIEEFDFDFYQGYQAFLLPDDIFKIETLQILRLSFCDFVEPELGSSFVITGLPRLRVVCFKNMSLRERTVVDALLRACLELETLELLDCCFPRYFRIAAGHLKKFRELKLATCPETVEVSIEAPSLTTLHYFGPMVVLKYTGFQKLTDCILDFKPQRPFFPIEAYKLHKLMYDMSNIVVLTTTSRLLEGLYPRYSDGNITIEEFFCLSKLKEIQLYMEGSRYCNILTIALFLSMCPSIEKIHIDCRSWFRVEKMKNNSKRAGGYSWAINQQFFVDRVLGPCYPNLKEVKLTGFRFDPHEMQLLVYFIETGLSLETVDIFIAPPRNGEGPIDFLEEAALNYHFQPRMASPNARIRVFQHFEDMMFYPSRNWHGQC